MKTKINKTSLKGGILMLLVSFLPTIARAQSYQQPHSIQEAINTPVIKDAKSRNAIANYQVSIGRGLYEKSNLYINMVREDEVIMISIPADLLFEPNSTELHHDADKVLRQFTGFLKAPDFYRMALAMYHDDTGSPNYCKEITDKRIQSVHDWFLAHSSARHIYQFSCGNSNPLLPNNSMENRRQNRRLEIYIIPGESMIEQAKKGLIK